MKNKGGKRTGSASRRPTTAPELDALIAAAKHVRRKYTRNELPLESDDDDDDEVKQPAEEASVEKPNTPNWPSVGVLQDATVRKVRACTRCVSVRMQSELFCSTHA